MNFEIGKAEFKGYGVRYSKNVLYVCADLAFLKTAGIIIYDSLGKLLTKVEIPHCCFTGDMACVYIKTYDFENCMYRFYCDEKEFVDPYARSLSSNLEYGVIKKDSSLKGFENDRYPCIPYSDSIIYLLNVKGYTMADSAVKTRKGTFGALLTKLPYFRSLSVTTLMLMPCYEVEKKKTSLKMENAIYSYKENPKDEPKDNLWGFGKGYHYALKKELFSTDNPENEFKAFIKKLHESNMECIVMMQYEPDALKSYVIDSLKYWVLNFHVDGFRLLGENLPINEILDDPVFKNTKIITENFDFEGYLPKPLFKYKNLASMRDTFKNSARRFLKADEDQVGYLSFAVRENAKYYASIRNITDFSGFTLNDLVSYNVKHNESNKEENTDGTDYNYSWNCGDEGTSKKRNVNNLRKKQVRNAMIMSLLCQGTPMITGGDEFLNTQNGNNNPYCQDNETGWVTLRRDKTAKDFQNFVKNLAAFRMRHVILHQPKELMLFDYMSCKASDVSFHSKDAFKIDQSPVSREFGVLYYGDYAKQYTGVKEDSVYIVYNMHWEKREFVLPLKTKGKTWKLLYSTDGSTDESFDEKNAKAFNDDSFVASERSITIFILTS